MASEAPKEIWAWVDDLAGIVGTVEEPEIPAHIPPGPNATTLCSKYIREDHALAMVAAGRQKALREAASWLRIMGDMGGMEIILDLVDESEDAV